MSSVTTEPEASLKLEAILNRSWRLFRDNPIAAVPIAAYTAVLVVLFAAAGAAAVVAVANASAGGTHDLPPSILAPIFGAWCVACVAGGVASAWIYAATYGLANALWVRGAATMSDGIVAARQRGGAVFVSLIGFAGLSIAAVVLALPTLFLSFLALLLFTMYAFPAAVGGGRPGFTAIRESMLLVRHAFGTSAIALLILWAIQQGISLLALPFLLPLQFSFMMSAANNDKSPHVAVWQIALAAGGYILIIFASCAYVGFMAIVQTGLYHTLSARAAGASQSASTLPVSQP